MWFGLEVALLLILFCVFLNRYWIFTKPLTRVLRITVLMMVCTALYLFAGKRGTMDLPNKSLHPAHQKRQYLQNNQKALLQDLQNDASNCGKWWALMQGYRALKQKAAEQAVYAFFQKACKSKTGTELC